MEKKIAMVSRKHFLQFAVSDKDDLQSLWDIVKELLLKKESVDIEKILINQLGYLPSSLIANRVELGIPCDCDEVSHNNYEIKLF